MAEDWAGYALEIAEAFTEIGTTFTGYRTIPGEFDPLEGAYGEGVELPFTVIGIYQSYQTALQLTAAQEDFNVLKGDRVMQVGTDGTLTDKDGNQSPYTPTTGDIFVIDGTNWILSNSTPTGPAGIPLLFTIAITQQ